MTSNQTTPAPRATRVAIDCRLMYYRKAGIAQYTRRLVQALAPLADARGGTLSILLDRRDTDTAWVPSGVPMLRTVTPAHHRLESITLPLELTVSNLKFQISLLHSPDFITARGPFKKVITIHDLYFLEHPEVMSAGGARYYGRIAWSAAQAGRIIAVSDFTRREILRLLPSIPAEKVVVIPEAANDQLPITDNQLPIPHPYALFVGTFEPRKNLVTLLRAMRDLPADFRLVVVGESGWGNSEPAQLARELGVDARVTFAGRVSDEALDAWYRGARLLALPSLSEGFGLPVLEAMMRGVPVVCSNAGSLPEVAGDAALLHDPLDTATLAVLMRVVWTSDAVYRDYGRRGQQRAATFSWAKTAQQTWGTYESAIRSA
jgi:glycosyltransferase involved in cell wall biosynthesis